MIGTILLGILVIAFILAYLYKATPKQNVGFKVLYLAMSFFTIFSYLWLSIHPQWFSIHKEVWQNGTLYQNETLTYSFNDNAISFLTTYSYAFLSTTILVLFIIFIMFVHNILTSIGVEQYEER